MDSDRWVVRGALNLPVTELPVALADGSVSKEPFYVVLGFAASTYGMATLGRASRERVVNVAQRGGIAVIVVGHPPGRLVV